MSQVERSLPAPRRAHAIYRGRVQGVGFRYATRAAASRFCVTGIVRNLMDGSVEVVAEGVEDEVRAFLSAVQSARRAFIREVAVQWEPATGEFQDFRIAF